MYSDKDGNVYRKNDSGKWEQIVGDGSKEINAQSSQELEQSLQMRSDGYRADYNYYNSMSGPQAHQVGMYYGVYVYSVSL
jgi:hypothetical protein